jgi:Ni,Fe-hydrogenase III large subunit
MTQQQPPPKLIATVGKVTRQNGTAIRVDELEGQLGRFVRVVEVRDDGDLRRRLHLRAGELRTLASLLNRAADNLDPVGTHGRER